MTRVFLSSINALAVLSVLLPAHLWSDVLRPAPAAASVVRGDEIPGFAEEAVAMGLVPATEVFVEDLGAAAGGAHLQVATTSATAHPFDAAVFFRRVTSHRLRAADGETTLVAASEMQVGHADGQVWVDFIDRFPQEIDEVSGRYTGLAGVEIRKRIEFEMTGFDILVDELGRQGSSLDEGAKLNIWQDLVDRGAITHGDLEQTVTIDYPDGSTRTMPAESFDAGAVFGLVGAGAGNESCVIGCFEDVGVTVTFLGAICLIAGAVVCAAACAVSAGVACIPCISGASLACGLGAAAGTLGYCLAKCLFGVDPPTPTRTPTRRPTPTPNRAIAYTIDAPSSVDTGSEFSVAWSASGAHSSTDWLAIYVPGAVSTDYGPWSYLTADLSGAATLVAPDDPGTYELRVLLANGYLEPSRPARAALSVIIADPGDCNDDERITINELIIGISIALGNRQLTDCINIDGNGDGTVQVAELIRAIIAALR